MIRIALSVGVLTSILLGSAARAGLVPIELSDFSGNETVVMYAGEMGDGTLVPIDGVSFGGVLHEYRVNGAPESESAVLTSFQMPVSIHTKPPRVMGDADDAVLSLTLPTATYRFGLDFLLNYYRFVPDVLEITAYDSTGVTLGALTYDAEPDLSSPQPVSGGFAGLESETPFTRVELRFGKAWGWQLPPDELPVGRVFQIDDLRFGPAFGSAVPEPHSSALVFLAGLIAFAVRSRSS